MQIANPCHRIVTKLPSAQLFWTACGIRTLTHFCDLHGGAKRTILGNEMESK